MNKAARLESYYKNFLLKSKKKNTLSKTIELKKKTICETKNSIEEARSGRPKTVSVTENVHYVSDNICCQEQETIYRKEQLLEI